MAENKKAPKHNWRTDLGRGWLEVWLNIQVKCNVNPTPTVGQVDLRPARKSEFSRPNVNVFEWAIYM